MDRPVSGGDAEIVAFDSRLHSQSSILTVLGCQRLDHSWQHLKKANLKRFCLYGSPVSAGFSKGSHSIPQAETQDNAEASLAEEDQVFITRRGKGKGGRSRPYMVQMAIRRTQDAMNLKNQILTYSPSRGKDGLVEKPMFADSTNPEVMNDSLEVDHPAASQDPGRREGTNSEDVPVNNDVPDVSWGDQESAWISQCLDQVQDVDEIAACEVADIGDSLSVLHAKTDLMPLSSPIMLIVSGASDSVAGRLWILNWLKRAGIDSLPSMTPSLEVFSFGNQRTYPSEGLLHLNDHVKALSSDNREIIVYLTLAFDVVDLNLPFLLSLQTLASMKSQIDFRTYELLLPEHVKIPLP